MKPVQLLLVFLLMAYLPAIAQQDTDLFNRLQALSNNGVDFMNADGMEITSQSFADAFSTSAIRKRCKKYGIKETELTVTDSALAFANFIVKKTDSANGVTQHLIWYFFTNKKKGFTAVSFTGGVKDYSVNARQIVQAIYDGAVPEEVYNPPYADSINFAGRKIALGSSCHWRGVNNVQCPYYGQMNWSVHSSMEDAWFTIGQQRAIISGRKGGKILSEDTVDVVFEGADTKAIRLIYDFTGAAGLLAGMSGGKTLTVYLVAATVRDHSVSCVMSYWNNDSIGDSGLAPLLEKMMKLKK